MRWDGSFDGPWSSEAVEKYRSGGFDGLSVTPGSEWNPASLDLLKDLPGLRFFNVRTRISDDLDAFRCETMEDLTLVTGSRRKIPEVVQPNLRSLCLTDRPGLEVGSRWPALEGLRIGAWRGVSLQGLRCTGSLTRMHLEGRRQKGTVEGIESCSSLAEFTAINYSVEDTAPLGNLSGLCEVKLLAASPTPSHGRVSFADIASPELSKVWISNARDLVEFQALRSFPKLREVRLIECRIDEFGMEQLSSLPSSVDVRLIDSIDS